MTKRAGLKSWGLTLLVCGATFVTLAGVKVFQINSAIAEAKAMPEYAETVAAAEAVPVQRQPKIIALGQLVSPDQMILRTELPGKIVAVNAQSGEHLEAGSIFVELDSSEQKAQLIAAEARQVLAQSSFERTRDLYRAKLASDQALDEARAALAEARSAVVTLKSVIEKKTIRAPFSGLVGVHDLEPGEYLQDNVELTSLVGDTSYLWVDFQVAQFYGDLALGTVVQVSVVRSSESQSALPATVVARDALVSEGSRNRLYRARLELNGDSLTPGSAVSVFVPRADSSELVAVPASAIARDSRGAFVYRLSPTGEDDPRGVGYRAERLSVEGVINEGALSLVKKGLAVGTLVAADGSFKLHEGMLVFLGGGGQ